MRNRKKEEQEEEEKKDRLCIIAWSKRYIAAILEKKSTNFLSGGPPFLAGAEDR